MKKFRAGLAALIVACITSLGMVLAAAPAQAWDPGTGGNTAPPRIAPPPSTTIPKVATPLKTPMIPPGILGPALKFLGTAGIGYMIGSTYRAVSCAGGVTPVGSFTPCTAQESAAHDAANSSPLLKVDPVPDKVWCVYNGGCSESGLAMAGTTLRPPNTGNMQIISTLSAPAAGSPQSVHVAVDAELGTYCAGAPTWGECQKGTIYGYTLSKLHYQGACKTSNGQITGLANGSGGNFTSKFSDVTSNTNLSAPGGADVALCNSGQVLQWTKILSQTGNNYAPSAAPAVWINPNAGGDMWKDTTITSNLTCKNQAGGSVTVSKTGPAGSGLAPVVSCPSGYLPDSGNTSVATNLLAAPEKVEEWSITPTVRETYPDCIGWQSAGCKLMIELDGVECNPGVAACRDWEEVFKHQPSRVKCKWGPYTLDISQCMVLRNSYIGETGTVNDPRRDPRAAPIAVDPFGNPLQNNPDPYAPTSPDTGTDPGTTPGSNPGPADIPQYGADPNNPTPSPGPSVTPNTSDTNCWPGGTAAFNPLEWVLQPVKCALSWAFVPKEANMKTQMTRVQDSFGKVGVVGAIGTVGTTITAVGSAAGSGSGCTGPTFNFDFNTVHQSMQPFNACAEPVATMALISRSFTTVVVIVMGVLGMVRAAGAGVGFNFSMGRGGGS